MHGALRILLTAASIALFAPSALAGPPFLTDDPEPTDAGHWEIYVPLIEGEGLSSDLEGSTGVEFNYGAARNLQITVGLPAAYAHNSSGWQWGRGDLEVSAKYRFFHNENTGLQIAAFPGVTIPTASKGMGADKVTGSIGGSGTSSARSAISAGSRSASTSATSKPVISMG